MWIGLGLRQVVLCRFHVGLAWNQLDGVNLFEPMTFLSPEHVFHVLSEGKYPTCRSAAKGRLVPHLFTRPVMFGLVHRLQDKMYSKETSLRAQGSRIPLPQGAQNVRFLFWRESFRLHELCTYAERIYFLPPMQLLWRPKPSRLTCNMTYQLQSGA